MLTEPNDLVVDPFGGSLTTGAVAEKLERRWLAGEAVEEYLKAGTFRFIESEENPKTVLTAVSSASRVRCALATIIHRPRRARRLFE
jgi:DNA modification methylase